MPLLLLGWNMQGNTKAVNLKTVLTQTKATPNDPIPDVICLQECGDLSNQFNFGQADQNGIRSAAVNFGTTSRMLICDIVWWPNPAQGIQYSLAILSFRGIVLSGSAPVQAPPLPAANPPNSRPILWIDVKDSVNNTWRIGCLHSPSVFSYPGIANPGAEIAEWDVAQIAPFRVNAPGRRWACLGDYNVDPEDLRNTFNQNPAVPNNLIEYGPKATQQAGYRIDYLVTDTLNVANFQATSEYYGNSDHYPQLFTIQ